MKQTKVGFSLSDLSLILKSLEATDFSFKYSLKNETVEAKGCEEEIKETLKRLKPLIGKVSFLISKIEENEEGSKMENRH